MGISLDFLDPRTLIQWSDVVTIYAKQFQLVNPSMCDIEGMFSFSKWSSNSRQQLLQEEKVIFYFFKGVQGTETMY